MESCIFCFEKVPLTTFMKIPCNHGPFFHKTCLEPWIKTHNKCPLCFEPIIDEKKKTVMKFDDLCNIFIACLAVILCIVITIDTKRDQAQALNSINPVFETFIRKFNFNDELSFDQVSKMELELPPPPLKKWSIEFFAENKHWQANVEVQYRKINLFISPKFSMTRKDIHFDPVQYVSLNISQDIPSVHSFTHQWFSVANKDYYFTVVPKFYRRGVLLNFSSSSSSSMTAEFNIYYIYDDIYS